MKEQDEEEINRLTNRHLARTLSNIEPLDEVRKNFIKSNIRWLVKDIMNVIEGNEGANNDYREDGKE